MIVLLLTTATHTRMLYKAEPLEAEELRSAKLEARSSKFEGQA
jgi:hypothetical protein